MRLTSPQPLQGKTSSLSMGVSMYSSMRAAMIADGRQRARQDQNRAKVPRASGGQRWPAARAKPTGGVKSTGPFDMGTSERWSSSQGRGPPSWQAPRCVDRGWRSRLRAGVLCGVSRGFGSFLDRGTDDNSGGRLEGQRFRPGPAGLEVGGNGRWFRQFRKLEPARVERRGKGRRELATQRPWRERRAKSKG